MKFYPILSNEQKSLPYLRYSLMQKELTIEGVRPPPHGAVSLPPQSQAIPQIQVKISMKLY
jgi:transcription initiation factor TFIID subunit 4